MLDDVLFNECWVKICFRSNIWPNISLGATMFEHLAGFPVQQRSNSQSCFSHVISNKMLANNVGTFSRASDISIQQMIAINFGTFSRASIMLANIFGTFSRASNLLERLSVAVRLKKI